MSKLRRPDQASDGFSDVCSTSSGGRFQQPDDNSSTSETQSNISGNSNARTRNTGRADHIQQEADIFSTSETQSNGSRSVSTRSSNSRSGKGGGGEENEMNLEVGTEQPTNSSLTIYLTSLYSKSIYYSSIVDNLQNWFGEVMTYLLFESDFIRILLFLIYLKVKGRLMDLDESGLTLVHSYRLLCVVIMFVLLDLPSRRHIVSSPMTAFYPDFYIPFRNYNYRAVVLSLFLGSLQYIYLLFGYECGYGYGLLEKSEWFSRVIVAGFYETIDKHLYIEFLFLILPDASRFKFFILDSDYELITLLLALYNAAFPPWTTISYLFKIKFYYLLYQTSTSPVIYRDLEEQTSKTLHVYSRHIVCSILIICVLYSESSGDLIELTPCLWIYIIFMKKAIFEPSERFNHVALLISCVYVKYSIDYMFDFFCCYN